MLDGVGCMKGMKVGVRLSNITASECGLCGVCRVCRVCVKAGNEDKGSG